MFIRIQDIWFAYVNKLQALTTYVWVGLRINALDRCIRPDDKLCASISISLSRLSIWAIQLISWQVSFDKISIEITQNASYTSMKCRSMSKIAWITDQIANTHTHKTKERKNANRLFCNKSMSKWALRKQRCNYG